MTEISIESLLDRDISELDKGGMPKPGKAHFLVGDYVDGIDEFTIISEMIGHEDPSEVGKQCKHFFKKGGGGAARAVLFAQATGIVTRDWLVREQAHGRKTLEIPYESSISRSFLGTLVLGKEYEAKDGTMKRSVQIAFDFKSPTSPGAFDYPVNSEYTDNLNVLPLQEAFNQVAAEEAAKKTLPAVSKNDTDNNEDIPF